MRIVVKVAIVLTAALILLAAGGWLFFVERRPDGPPPVTSSGDMVAGQQATALLTDLYETHAMPSLSAAVGLNGQVLWSGTVGYADLSTGRPAGADTRYRVGSVSKPITAIAVMRLVDQGVIDLDAPYAAHVPDFPSAAAGYSLKQLLSHQAGIRHYLTTGEISSNVAYAGPREATRIFADDPLLFPPGTGFNYSSYGYTAVALAMERATGLPYGELVRQLVLDPAGMAHTGLDIKGAQIGDQATGYMAPGGLLIAVLEDDLSDRQAGGGYLSTPRDLVRLGGALTSGSLLMPDSRNLMWTPVPLADGTMNPQRYALGFREGTDDLGRFLHHGGRANGGLAMLLIYPDLGLTVALCANYDGAGAAFDRLLTAQRLAALFTR